MNKIVFFRKFLLALCFITITFQYSCKENIYINSKVAPSNDSIGVFQKYLGCVTHTYFDDSIITSSNYPGIPYYQAVGVITDPFFGSLNCATYFQIIPSENGFSFATTDTIDSAVLILPYSGFTYGDSTNQSLTQTYQVFYMADSMGDISTATYFPYTKKSIDLANPLSSPFTVNVYHLIDSFAVTGKDHSALHIKLNTTTFMNRINNAITYCNAGGNPTEQLFINYFNGICIKPADSRMTCGAMPYFQLDGIDPYSEAGVLVYYHQNVGDSTFAQFYFNTTYCTHFNSVVNSYGHNPINNLYHSTKPNDDIIALQNQPGASIDLKIGGISTLPTGIINKAEIQLTMLPGYNNNSTFFAPEKLYVTGISTNGSLSCTIYPAGLGYIVGEVYNVADRYPLFSLSPFTVMDGLPHTTIGTTGATTYTIDIPRELMQAIAMKSDTIHVLINGTNDYYGAFHMVAGGGNYSDSNYRAKFKVVYSQLKN